MRVIITRVSEAKVSINSEIVGAINNGLLVLAAWEDSDTSQDVEWIANKIVNLRIFSDNEGKMNISLLDLNYEILIVSQFTLYAATAKGNRPSFIRSAKPDTAIALYNSFIEKIKNLIGENKVQTGIFGADMKVHSLNNGPVTIIIDSKQKDI
jgi:D-tyrosyl-tRNA(Tyr) deacylase